MKATPIAVNAIVVADVFNPSVLHREWLIRQKLLREDDLGPGFVFSSQLAHVPTTDYVLSVVPQQLQFFPADRDKAKLVVPVGLASLIRSIPHTPVTALGMNFLWELDADSEPVEAFTRRLFSVPGFPLATEFNSVDAHFGSYMSKDVNGCRLKLDIKPTKLTLPGKPERVTVVMTFNFHCDVAGEGASEKVASMLEQWATFDLLAEVMANKVAAGHS